MCIECDTTTHLTQGIYHWLFHDKIQICYYFQWRRRAFLEFFFMQQVQPNRLYWQAARRLQCQFWARPCGSQGLEETLPPIIVPSVLITRQSSIRRNGSALAVKSIIIFYIPYLNRMGPRVCMKLHSGLWSVGIYIMRGIINAIVVLDHDISHPYLYCSKLVMWYFTSIYSNNPNELQRLN